MFWAVRVVIRSGGIDLAASLAYFTILSLLPAVALFIMGIAIFGNPEDVRGLLTGVLVYYFPMSEELILGAVENLVQRSWTLGLVAFGSLALGANGLFMAANRSVNRVFGLDTPRVLHITVTQVTVTTTLVLLFLLSVGVSAVLQAALRFSEGVAELTGVVSTVVILGLGIVSALVPAFFTMVVFTLLYFRMPSVRVAWKDALFGAMTAIVLFEVGKQLFFWFTNLASQRNEVYGPIASFVVLMMWGYAAGLIFLYGAALTRVAGQLRPWGGSGRWR